MQNVLHSQTKLSKSQNRELLKMYKLFKSNENPIHNLTTGIVIPEYIYFILSLGLKFCLLTQYNTKLFKAHFEEGLRKLGWILYFKEKGNENILSNFDKFLINIKKKDNFRNKPFCPNQNSIFPELDVTSKFLKILNKKYKKSCLLPNDVLKSFQNFINSNNLIIKNADKNAGICLMHKLDYDQEIFKQLEDLSIYVPTTSSHFHYKMQTFEDKVRCSKIIFNNDNKLRTLLPKNFKPTSFYVLPKIHKFFEKFPPGRPISNTSNTFNRNISALVDYILKPIMSFIPNLLIDTNHFLLLLNNLKLNDNEKYVLITYDVNSMYTALKLSNCKKFCLLAFKEFKSKLELPFPLSEQQLGELLNFCLDYNYLQYDNNYFIQIQGIQMGNAASVCIANITAYYELKDMFKNKPEIQFNVRFVDDGFLIVKCTNIDNILTWCEQTFQHNYLKFTITSNNYQLNFLDVLIKLSDKQLSTTLYAKPMAKNTFLHYCSNHPKQLLNSLPYSQFLRIKKICSDENDVLLLYSELSKKFLAKGYPLFVINAALEKIECISRKDILKPKTKLLLNSLMEHNPCILYDYQICTLAINNLETHKKTFIVMPFYKNMFNFKHNLISYIKNLTKGSNNPNYHNILKEMNIVISFKKVNSLEKYCKIKTNDLR